MVGEGDMASASGERGRTLSQFQAEQATTAVPTWLPPALDSARGGRAKRVFCGWIAAGSGGGSKRAV